MSAKRRVWAGLSSQGLTPLSMDERVHLHARTKRLLQLLILGLIGPFASIGAMAWILVSTEIQAVVLVGCFGLGVILPIVSVMLAEDARKRRKGLKRDLARGEVEVFRGVVKAIVGMDAALTRLARDGTLVTEREHEVRIFVESGYLFAVDGVYRKDFLKPDVLEVASASAPLRQPSEAGPPKPRLFMLNVGERAELKERASQLWRTPLPAFAAVAYAALGVVMWVSQDDAWLYKYKVPAIVWGVIGVGGLIQLLRRYRTAMRVGRDAESGEAFEIYGRSDSGVTQRLVVLKESKLLWSVDDLPAEWRSKKV
ncbi:MAG: hypothetical protein ACI9KE_002727 [Polyangiales bacterium]|jgi:hypothetical protein